MSIIAERLRIARLKRGMKQTDVKSKTGINNKTLSGYENNVAEPDLKTLKALAELYGVSMEWLVGNTNNPSPFTEEENEVLNKLNNAVPIDQIAKEHEISVHGKILNEKQKKLFLMYIQTLVDNE